MSKEIIVYTSAACTSCRQVQEFLTQKGVDFQVRDISADMKALDELAALGYLATPVTVIDGEAVAGFNRKRLEALLQER